MASFSSVSSDDIGIWVNAKARSLRHRNPASLRGERSAIDRCFQIKPAPLDHGVRGAQRGGRMDRRQQAGSVVEGVRYHRDVVHGRKGKDLAQFAYASHLGRAWLNKVHRLRGEQALEI